MKWIFKEDEILLREKTRFVSGRYNKKTKDTVFFKFTKDIPWHCEDDIISQTMLPAKWDSVFRDRQVIIFTPGYLLEVIVSVMLYKICVDAGLKVKILCPSYYKKLLDFYKIPSFGKEGEHPIAAFERMQKAFLEYPAPVFFDNDNNVYVNSLFHYGYYINNRGKYTDDKNDKSFISQICDNLCCSYFPSLFEVRNTNSIRIFEEYVLSKGAKNKKIILLDNSMRITKSAGNQYLLRKYLFDHDIATIAKRAGKDYTVLVMEDYSKRRFIASNVRLIEPWYDTSSDIVFSLLQNSEGIISSDPNMYLSAWLLKCKNIYSYNTKYTSYVVEKCNDLISAKSFYYGDGSIMDILEFVRRFS